MHPQKGMNYYTRLEVYGWKKFHQGARWDYYKKKDKHGRVWIVAVPWTTFVEPIFYRKKLAEKEGVKNGSNNI
jgi:hypothetical protein